MPFERLQTHTSSIPGRSGHRHRHRCATKRWRRRRPRRRRRPCRQQLWIVHHVLIALLWLRLCGRCCCCRCRCRCRRIGRLLARQLLGNDALPQGARNLRVGGEHDEQRQRQQHQHQETVEHALVRRVGGPLFATFVMACAMEWMCSER